MPSLLPSVAIGSEQAAVLIPVRVHLTEHLRTFNDAPPLDSTPGDMLQPSLQCHSSRPTLIAMSNMREAP